MAYQESDSGYTTPKSFADVDFSLPLNFDGDALAPEENDMDHFDIDAMPSVDDEIAAASRFMEKLNRFPKPAHL